MRSRGEPTGEVSGIGQGSEVSVCEMKGVSAAFLDVKSHMMVFVEDGTDTKGREVEYRKQRQDVFHQISDLGLWQPWPHATSLVPKITGVGIWPRG